MIAKGDRIVIPATGQTGTVTDVGTAHSNPGDIWEERVLHVKLDDNDLFEITIRDAATQPLG